MRSLDFCQENILDRPCRDSGLDRVFASIVHLGKLYPDFGLWFWTKVVPGLGNGSRRIIPVHMGQSLAALAILKRMPDERKISTLWVAPFARRLRIGYNLMCDSLIWLDCEKPTITVCQERLHELQPLLQKFGFTLEQVCDSYYRPGRPEYVFNGLMSQTKDVFQRFEFATSDLSERASGAHSLPLGLGHL